MNSLRGSVQDLTPGSVIIVGVPSDENSSFMRGAALAPMRIREVLYSGASNLCAENAIDLRAEPGWRDLSNSHYDRPVGHAGLNIRLPDRFRPILARYARASGTLAPPCRPN